MKEYLIHDNGGRPFRVDIQGMKVSVWKNMDEYGLVDGKFVTTKHPMKHSFDFMAEKIFIGKKSPDGGYDGLKPKEAEGNSILLQVGSKYVYIGYEIYEFSPVKGDTIVKYYSDIGHSDVPYPYAVGKTHVYILLEDKVAIPLDYFHGMKEIYQQYYEAVSYLPMCLKGYDPKDICKDKKAARERIQELKDKVLKLKTKTLQKRI